MKKFLTLILIGIMMISSVSAATENIPENESSQNGVLIQKTQLGQLYDMGIMKDVGEGPHQNITRAQMAKIVVQTLNIPEFEIENTFLDVSKETDYANEIGIVQNLKIMCGYGNGLFMPDEDITYYEVVKTIVTMLGYEPLAQQKGGYHQGYFTVGNELGLVVYPAAEDKPITKDDIAKILIKAIDVPLMKQTSFGNSPKYQIMPEETIKRNYLGIND
ncbi:MAG: S-layer homology domain-containing protein [Ruminococcaceae bacterium]|nr:S-layer homology domain-containing protein [Oscillospiraceae bacterium]